VPGQKAKHGWAGREEGREEGWFRHVVHIRTEDSWAGWVPLHQGGAGMPAGLHTFTTPAFLHRREEEHIPHWREQNMEEVTAGWQ